MTGAAAGAMVQLVRADFLERVRRTGFLFTMLAAVYLGFAVNAGYITLTLGDYRGRYDSAWIGTMVALTSAVFISMVGFYIVKDSVARDRSTRVGQILAATRVGTFAYLFSKTLSNFLVLSSIVAVQIAAAALMLLLKGGEGADAPPFEPVALLLPFICITFPALAFVSGLAVLFESIRWLSGGFGNVVYFFLFNAMMAVPIAAEFTEPDALYIMGVQRSMHEGARRAYPGFKGGFLLHAGPRMDEETPLKQFAWEGIRWDVSGLARRLAWLLSGIALTFVGVPFFDRFDRTGPAKRGPRSSSGAGLQAIDRAISGVARAFGRTRTGRLLAAELRLMLKGVHPFWFLAAAGLGLACLLSPVGAVRYPLLAIAWIWPVLLWSKLGMREEFHGTGQLVFSAPKIRTRQLLACWGAGVIVAIGTGAGALISYAVSGEWGALAGAFSGVLFIPSLALAMGVWSGGSRLFEAVYTFWWYLGPMNRVPALDFTGAGSTPAIAAAYLVAAAACFLAAELGRRRRP